MIAPVEPAAVLFVEIPGAPCAQGRGRAVRTAGGVRVIDPAASRSWKGAAAVHMLAARAAAGRSAPFAVPLEVYIVAYFARPKSLRGAGEPWRPSRPDSDNLGKAALDAGNGVLWLDDALVVRLVVEKRYASEGASARVAIAVTELLPVPALTARAREG